MATVSPRKILIDTDPGVDDAMAIFYALASPELEVVGLTTVFGNAATPICTQNALRLLEIAGRTDIPVAVGADRPLVRPFEGGAAFVHGDDGQGNVLHLSAPQTTPLNIHAAQFIIEQVERYPGQLTLVPIGPLTNIALALTLKPEIAAQIEAIVLMGGNGFVPGNITPAAEANIYNDPEAADIVFGADCSITMIGLDVTEKIIMSTEQLDYIASIDNPRAQHLAQIVPFYRAFYRDRYGMDAIHIHDSSTITYLLAPELFEVIQRPVRVEMGGQFSRGKTWAGGAHADREGAWTGRRAVNICVGVDSAKAVAMELARLEGV